VSMTTHREKTNTLVTQISCCHF